MGEKIPVRKHTIVQQREGNDGEMYLKSSYVTNDTEQIHGVNGDNEATFFVYCFDVA